MNNDFVAEILRATGSLRSGDPWGATAIIQAALAAGGLAPSNPDVPNRDVRLLEMPWLTEVENDPTDRHGAGGQYPRFP